MARTEDDTWDLATSVGATATGVAVGRALASRVDNPLINDPFAEPLVRAVGVDFFTRLASGELDPGQVDGDSAWGMTRMRDMTGVRTRFFDDFFLAATTGSADGGIRQAVILASGLDTRAYRLPWPAGTTVYEIDQPQVIDFKTQALADLGVTPTADRRTVGIDLRHDWQTELTTAGFDTAQPAAWSAEGLMPFLPPEAQDKLLDGITMLSAAGSRLATDNLADASRTIPMMAARMRAVTDRWREHGFDVEMTDLWYPGDRTEVVDYLAGHGWRTVATSIADLFAAHSLSVHTKDAEEAALFSSRAYVTATRV